MNLMMVDDNAVDQMLYRRIVERSGLVSNLFQYTSPVEALDYLLMDALPRPDLILLDINMPEMDGFEFLEKSTDALGPDMCPVFVMLTTSLNQNDKGRAKRFCVVKDFLNKPLTLDVLRDVAKLVKAPRKSA
ncbi:response regulator [Yoonia sediminilitoris]|uniref:Response regulator receiver domain-containing protein n=1 Tax=Yoonia sediminilitoris TaxID=1286148 RepID=A0A2T6K7X9_9RHOB|nr:response regulator [Yoonia sediminilitoris]PUB10840.1 response regulator receiver domain-containing protein [Yoonia sediminilitoris]RCW90515.1 response regulator receiver domain-containing protein [Yoonia sediminilitoris]